MNVEQYVELCKLLERFYDDMNDEDSDADFIATALAVVRDERDSAERAERAGHALES